VSATDTIQIMNIFLIRHGKSDKSLQDKLSHNEFELQRGLVEGEVEKARQLGKILAQQVERSKGYDLVWSGKMRSQQTVLAVAEGLGLSTEAAKENLREDFGLTYLAEKEYWHECEEAITSGQYDSHAEYFLKNPSLSPQTFTAQYMQKNMRSVLRRAIERNIFLNNDNVVMVSHEPVISLCMADLTEKSVSELGGPCHELEYAQFIVMPENSSQPRVELLYRSTQSTVNSALFSLS
jgi:phosphohistidine phosphatase SixA